MRKVCSMIRRLTIDPLAAVRIVTPVLLVSVRPTPVESGVPHSEREFLGVAVALARGGVVGALSGACRRRVTAAVNRPSRWVQWLHVPEVVHQGNSRHVADAGRVSRPHSQRQEAHHRQGVRSRRRPRHGGKPVRYGVRHVRTFQMSFLK